MPQQILIIHGGDAFETYQEYIKNLRGAELTLERLQKKDWKARLGETLGSEYDVIAPRMPNSQNARYAEWKIWFEKILPLLNDEVILIGHSLGGIFIAKYLSENSATKKIKATVLVAAPYNTATQDPLVDFNIEQPFEGLIKQGGQIFLYHSTDDTIVPFSHFEQYQKELPTAKLRTFTDKQHFNQPEFPEILADIRALK